VLLGVPPPHVRRRVRRLGRSRTHGGWTRSRASSNWCCRQSGGAIPSSCSSARLLARSPVGSERCFPGSLASWHAFVFLAHGKFRPMTGYSALFTVLTRYTHCHLLATTLKSSDPIKISLSSRSTAWSTFRSTLCPMFGAAFRLLCRYHVLLPALPWQNLGSPGAVTQHHRPL
jgi:hypothetical protein